MSSPLGRPLPHESALGHVSGTARYIDDLPAPPGLLVGMVVGSSVAHGRLVGIDRSRALQVPGVHGVFTASDIPGENNVGPVVHDEPMLAEQLVHCVGQAFALVVAESLEACRVAAKALEVEIEELPAITDLEQGLAAGAFIGDPHVICRGDPDEALADAPHTLSGTLDSGGQEHFYLETQAALAVPGEGRQITVHSSTQHPSEVQTLVANTLGWGRSRVTVACPRMGGGFGGKETQAAPYACLAALAAQKTGRPVKLWLCRDDDMQLTGRRHPFHSRWSVGFDDEGRILALTAELNADAGWATDLSLSILDRGLFHMDNTYWLPNVRLEGRVVRTNRISNTAFRGFGGPQGMLVVEHIVERVAHHLGLDPLEVRRRNYYGEAPRNHTPYGQEVRDFRMDRITDELVASSELAARREAVASFNASHRHRKRAIAFSPLKFGISFTASFLNQAGAYVLLYADGTVQLNHGGTEMGQGLYTKMLQICSHALGAPLADIVHQTTATDKVPNTSATAASSGSDLNGQAVRAACNTLVERLRPVAAGLLGCTVEEMGCASESGEHREVDGRPAWAWHGTSAVTLAEVAGQAYLQQVPLAAAGFYRTPDIGYDRKAGQGKPFHYFAYGASVSEVEVDGLTGEWRLLRVDILHDVGESLSHAIDRGQVEGAYAQGLGWLTWEELVFDDRGALLTHGPSTYKIPAIGDLPEDFRVSLLERAPQEGVIYGSKAVGEPPFMLAIGTHHAISRAVSAFGPAGTDVPVAVPATNEAILAGVTRAREPT